MGKRNEALLRERAGLSCYEALEENFCKVHQRQPERMAEFLSTTATIRPHFAKAIALHVAQTLRDKEEQGAERPNSHYSPADNEDRLTICVEGNISAGKSTFLNTIHGSTLCGQRVRVVPEPVDKWTNIPGLSEMTGGVPLVGEHNILAAYYKNPERWGYTFQNWVFFTRFMQEKDSQIPPQAAANASPVGAEALLRAGVDYRLMERSVFSDRLVFVEALKEKSTLNPMELAIYGSWFDFMLRDQPSLVPDAFIYLQASPKTCHQRMTVRARGEEAGVPLDYLSILHDKHEGWFRQNSGLYTADRTAREDRAYRPGGADPTVVSLIDSYPKAGLEMSEEKWRVVAGELINDIMPASIRGSVRFMRTDPGDNAFSTASGGGPVKLVPPGSPSTFSYEGLHHERVIRRVPALILDCDGHVDVTRDVVAREEYARKVAEFYEFVAKLKKHVYPVLGHTIASSKRFGPAVLPDKWGSLSPEELNALEEQLRRAMREARAGTVHLPSSGEQRMVAASRC